eukprot:6184543-Alexandrium_andersonii.AAC.1
MAWASTATRPRRSDSNCSRWQALGACFQMAELNAEVRDKRSRVPAFDMRCLKAWSLLDAAHMHIARRLQPL